MNQEEKIKLANLEQQIHVIKLTDSDRYNKIVKAYTSNLKEKEELFKSWSSDLQTAHPQGGWRTINGAKVFIDGGKVVAGLDGFNKHIDELHSKKKETSSPKKGEFISVPYLSGKIEGEYTGEKNSQGDYKIKTKTGGLIAISSEQYQKQESKESIGDKIKRRSNEIAASEAEAKKNKPTYAERTKLDESKVHPSLLKMKDLAMRASSNTSFDPELRGKQILEGYSAELNEDIEEIKKHGGDVDRYVEKYTSMMSDWLGAKSRTISSMITGGSNFPVRRAEAANRSEHNKSVAFTEWRKKALKAITKPEDQTIVRGTEGATTKLEEKLGRLEEAQKTMKDINSIIKKKNVSDEDKIKNVLAKYPKIGEKSARELLKPDYGGRIGFPSYSLTNNNATINRLKKDIAYEKERLSKYEEGNKEYEIGGVKVVENVEDNRIQLHFDGKPEVEMRSKLKSNGFRWSPKNQTWQRQLTNAAIHSTKMVLN